MQISESSLKEMIARQDVAFQQLRADMHKFMWGALVASVGLFVTVVVFVAYGVRVGGG